MSFVKVSVIMAAYNAGPYVDEAIRSVLEQKGVPFELLVGDDASTDRTWSCLQAHQKDPRLRAVRFRKRRGPGAVRNDLIERARGRFLSICDADDIMLPGNLHSLSLVLDRFGDVGVVYGESRLIDSKGRRLRRRVIFPGPAGQWDLLRNATPHPGTMLRRNLLRRVGGYPPDLVLMEDHDLFLRLAEITDFKPLVGKVTYLWRRHRASLTGAISRRQWLRIRTRIVAKAIERRYHLGVSW